MESSEGPLDFDYSELGEDVPDASDVSIDIEPDENDNLRTVNLLDDSGFGEVSSSSQALSSATGCHDMDLKVPSDTDSV